VEEEKPEAAHRILLNKAREGYSALGIVRSHPKNLRAKAGNADITCYGSRTGSRRRRGRSPRHWRGW